MNERILVVDDDEDQCRLMEGMLSRLGYAVSSCREISEAFLHAEQTRFSAILTDIELGDVSGLFLCEQLHARMPGVPIVVMTGYQSVDRVAEAIRAGAFDYLAKPVSENQLSIRVARAVQHSRLLTEIARLHGVQQIAVEGCTLRGNSAAMRQLRELIERVARTDASVLIHGETGTGKELVARTIHSNSPRSAGPFVALNCAAVPASLLESELFGHARGAFTDAKSARDGLFVQASGGTLFLDEIGEMPLDMQAKLLRALQERKVRPVGADAELPFNARILAASHRDLEVEVEQRRFRQDLFYRINVVRVDVPALRERRTDILELADYFLGELAERLGRQRMVLSPQVAECLLNYDWPGNVRELENCMERVTALGRFAAATSADLPQALRPSRPQVLSDEPLDQVRTLAELERMHINQVLQRTSGNKSRAAQLLGLDRRTLYRKLDAYAARAVATGCATDVLQPAEAGAAE